MVTWLDAQDHPDKWVDATDAEDFGDQECEITSLGILVRQTDKYLTLAGDYDPTDNDYGRVTKIPSSMIKSITPLEPPHETPLR